MIPSDYLNQVVTGDARQLAERLPAESIDMVYTDPPYPREYLSLYGWLAETAARVLRPGGYLFAYAGAETLPEVLDRLRVPDLSYFWVDVILHHWGQPRVWYKKLLSGYKPVVIFTKGPPSIVTWRCTIDMGAVDKRHHAWGQPVEPVIRRIGMLTEPGMVVLDPFAGGGTVPGVCRMLGRQYVAFEIDPDAAQAARVRVEQTQAMAPVFLEQQAEMPL